MKIFAATVARSTASCLAYQPSATAAMTNDTLLPFDLPAVRRKKLTVDFDGGTQSDAGLLLLREAERKFGVCRRLAAAMPDRRDPDRILHEMFEMVAARAMAIACGYKDAIDHDRLRHDPLMKAAVGRCPQTGALLASQSTISRLENAPSKTEAARLAVALLDQFGTTMKPGRMEPRHRRHVLRGARRPATGVLERAS
jgi:Transposase DDE domain group 1